MEQIKNEYSVGTAFSVEGAASACIQPPLVLRIRRFDKFH